MKEITVTVHPDNKKVPAFLYDPTVILVQKRLVYDTDQSIVTDDKGFRYKRSTYAGETQMSVFSEYRKL